MKKILSTLLFLNFIACSYAQTPYVIDQNTNKCCGGDNNGMGSSFLSSAAGNLDSIEVYIRTGSFSTGTLNVYSGNTNNSASLIYTQALTGIPTGIGNAPYIAKLTTPVSLDASSTYTFMIYNTPLRFGHSDTYLNGSLWIGAGAFITEGEHPDKDLDFIAYIGDLQITSLSHPDKKRLSYFIEKNNILLKNFAGDIRLYNLQGGIVASGKGKKIEFNNSLAGGFYILYVRDDNNLYVEKVYLKP